MFIRSLPVTLCGLKTNIVFFVNENQLSWILLAKPNKLRQVTQSLMRCFLLAVQFYIQQTVLLVRVFYGAADLRTIDPVEPAEPAT